MAESEKWHFLEIEKDPLVVTVDRAAMSGRWQFLILPILNHLLKSQSTLEKMAGRADKTKEVDLMEKVCTLRCRLEHQL